MIARSDGGPCSTVRTLEDVREEGVLIVRLTEIDIVSWALSWHVDTSVVESRVGVSRCDNNRVAFLSES